MAAEPGRPFSALELDVWRGLLRTHARLTRSLSRALEDSFRLTISEFEVLIALSPSECCGLRMTDLAQAITLTPSGLTRLVDRMERRGLVARTRSAEVDGRALVVTITDAGRGLFAEASRAHRARVRGLFLSRLSTDEMRVLTELFNRLEEEARPDT